MQPLLSLWRRLADFVRRLRITFLPVLVLLALPRHAAARDIYVAPNGSDTNPGTLAAPYQTLAKAGAALYPGDHVYLRQGAYRGGIRIRQPGVTMEPFSGESVTIALPLGDPLTNTVWVFKSNVTLRNLDISGGYYPVKFETYATGGRLEGCHIHHSGADAVKVVPLCSGVTVTDCEIDHTGRALTNCQGIDAVNANRLTVTRCRLHDIPNVAVSIKGGSQYGLVSDCWIERCRIGVQVGQDTDRASMWPNGYPGDNPGGYESRDQVVENNVIIDTTASGISCWAALRPQIRNNVILEATTDTGAGINLQPWTHYPPTGNPFTTACETVLIAGNVVRLRASSTRFAVYVQPGAVKNGLTLRGNAYYQPGRDVVFVDSNNPASAYKGTYPGWAARMSETGSLVLPQPPAGLSGPPVLPPP